MRSIKEKAEEYSLIEQGVDPSSYRDFNINKKDAFIAGANCVSEQIIEAIRLCDNDRHTDLYKSLWDCIDELRK